MSDSRASTAVSAGSVKRLVFRPSGRIIWMVVGTDNEHWADPDLGFCTCKDFYFKALSGGSECYHLKSIGKAKEASQFVQTDFDDSEYIPFLQAIMDDQATLLSRG